MGVERPSQYYPIRIGLLELITTENDVYDNLQTALLLTVTLPSQARNVNAMLPTVARRKPA